MQRENKKLIAALVTIGIIFLLLKVYTVQVKATPKRKYKCTDFRIQKDAQKAYEQGATYLDGDHNGVACQGRPN